MLNQTSEEFRVFFLLEFTKQLIRNSADVEMLKLALLVNKQEEGKIQSINLELDEGKKEVIKEKKEIKRFVKEKIKQKEQQEGEYISSVKGWWEEERTPFTNMPYKSLIKRNLPLKRPFFIPEQNLPERLQYLRPLPMPGEIDLGKINNFIQDPVIRAIECNGPNKEIIINGLSGSKETHVTLTKEEIEEVLKKFSEETKIPLQEGFFKVVHGKLILSAVYSESVGSKFIIKKMIIAPPKPIFLGRR